MIDDSERERQRAREGLKDLGRVGRITGRRHSDRGSGLKSHHDFPGARNRSDGSWLDGGRLG